MHDFCKTQCFLEIDMSISFRKKHPIDLNFGDLGRGEGSVLYAHLCILKHNATWSFWTNKTASISIQATVCNGCFLEIFSYCIHLSINTMIILRLLKRNEADPACWPRLYHYTPTWWLRSRTLPIVIVMVMNCLQAQLSISTFRCLSSLGKVWIRSPEVLSQNGKLSGVRKYRKGRQAAL